MEVVDISLFNNELDILDLRVKILEGVVDHFFVLEATTTHQGTPKECLGKTYVHPKVHMITFDFPDGLSNWDRVQYNREYPVDFEAFGVSPDSIVLTSDLDEIPDPNAVKFLKENFNPEVIYSFEQQMHQYYLNVQNLSEPWNGTRACTIQKYREWGSERLRNSEHLTMKFPNAGWHWSFLGGEKMIEEKIRSFAHTEYLNEETLSNIKNRLLNNEDVFNRGHKLVVVELGDSYPEYVLQNKEKLAHLIRKK
jgi:beta-1,4-mannosyl-glycoprotein beta-1,4-N-acetylglucosaminyltransferase